jgi:choline-sulfatase
MKGFHSRRTRQKHRDKESPVAMDRRRFLAGGVGVAGAGLLAACSDGGPRAAAPVSEQVTTTTGPPPVPGPTTTATGAAIEARRPNILFLYADQHRADVLGAAGNELVVTPNLDRLAAEGLRCTQAWTESPICQAARASMLTATYPTDHGVLGNFVYDSSPDWNNVPKTLQAAGYTTASIGKTHYSQWPFFNTDQPPPTDEWIASFGFDHVVEEFDRYVHTGRWDTPYTRFLGASDMLEEYQDAIRSRFFGTPQAWEGLTSPLPQELDLTSFLAGEAEGWLASRTGDDPWFLQLSFVQPHEPLMGDPIWVEHYSDVEIPRTAPTIAESSHPGWDRHLQGIRNHSNSELLTDAFVLAGARQYYAMVSLIDQKIGELLAGLEARGQLDNTLVIYASDHGEMLGDHGLMSKLSFYRSSVRVPLIIRPPQGMDPIVHEGPVQAFDIAATVLDAADTQLDNTPARSLLPLLDGATSHRESAASMIRMVPTARTWVGVTDGTWRATFDNDSGELVELFDLESDPDEATNRWQDAPTEPLERLRAHAEEATQTWVELARPEEFDSSATGDRSEEP